MLIADGHLTEVPLDSVNSGVVSLHGLCLQLVDKSSTVLCASMSIHGFPGSGILSQLLVTLKYAKTGLET